VIHKNPLDEILHFKRTLAEWRWMSQISEYPDEVIRLLNIDARKLGELAYLHPEHASECVMLMDDFKLLANDVQERMHKRRKALVSGTEGTDASGTYGASAPV
jgi:hypothetical protein